VYSILSGEGGILCPAFPIRCAGSKISVLVSGLQQYTIIWVVQSSLLKIRFVN
jgi:hypothetical protein